MANKCVEKYRRFCEGKDRSIALMLHSLQAKVRVCHCIRFSQRFSFQHTESPQLPRILWLNEEFFPACNRTVRVSNIPHRDDESAGALAAAAAGERLATANPPQGGGARSQWRGFLVSEAPRSKISAAGLATGTSTAGIVVSSRNYLKQTSKRANTSTHSW